jgi:pyruvate dehydrogenase (quinone)
MLMCEFLTAVYYKLPIKALVYNNLACGLIALEAEAIGVPAYYQALDFPNPDYVALARACGGVGFKAKKPGELRDAIDKALKADGPGHCRLRGSADELPNVPHIELEELGNFAKVKIRKQSSPRPAGDDGPIPSWFQRR